jgi:hypothetical protein
MPSFHSLHPSDLRSLITLPQQLFPTFSNKSPDLWIKKQQKQANCLGKNEPLPTDCTPHRLALIDEQ